MQIEHLIVVRLFAPEGATRPEHQRLLRPLHPQGTSKRHALNQRAAQVFDDRGTEHDMNLVRPVGTSTTPNAEVRGVRVDLRERRAFPSDPIANRRFDFGLLSNRRSLGVRDQPWVAAAERFEKLVSPPAFQRFQFVVSDADELEKAHIARRRADRLQSRIVGDDERVHPTLSSLFHEGATLVAVARVPRVAVHIERRMHVDVMALTNAAGGSAVTSQVLGDILQERHRPFRAVSGAVALNSQRELEVDGTTTRSARRRSIFVAFDAAQRPAQAERNEVPVVTGVDHVNPIQRSPTFRPRAFELHGALPIKIS